MPTRFYPGNIYHLYNRGNNRQSIFLEAENYRFFLFRLLSSLQKVEVDLLAYCLMPNHYHILILLFRLVHFFSKSITAAAVAFIPVRIVGSGSGANWLE